MLHKKNKIAEIGDSLRDKEKEIQFLKNNTFVYLEQAKKDAEMVENYKNIHQQMIIERNQSIKETKKIKLVYKLSDATIDRSV